MYSNTLQQNWFLHSYNLYIHTLQIEKLHETLWNFQMEALLNFQLCLVLRKRRLGPARRMRSSHPGAMTRMPILSSCHRGHRSLPVTETAKLHHSSLDSSWFIICLNHARIELEMRLRLKPRCSPPRPTSPHWYGALRGPLPQLVRCHSRHLWAQPWPIHHGELAILDVPGRIFGAKTTPWPKFAMPLHLPFPNTRIELLKRAHFMAVITAACARPSMAFGVLPLSASSSSEHIILPCPSRYYLFQIQIMILRFFSFTRNCNDLNPRNPRQKRNYCRNLPAVFQLQIQIRLPPRKTRPSQLAAAHRPRGVGTGGKASQPPMGFDFNVLEANFKQTNFI